VTELDDHGVSGCAPELVVDAFQAVQVKAKQGRSRVPVEPGIADPQPAPEHLAVG